VFVEGGVLLEGQVIDEKDDLDVALLVRVRFVLADELKGLKQ
jgi:hypothetical protein